MHDDDDDFCYNFYRSELFINVFPLMGMGSVYDGWMDGWMDGYVLVCHPFLCMMNGPMLNTSQYF